MKINRELDGVYFRVQRNDKWENICFSDLDPEEMDEIINSNSDEWLEGLAQILLRTICEMRNSFDKEIFCSNNNIKITENTDVKMLVKQFGIVLHNIGDTYDIISKSAGSNGDD